MATAPPISHQVFHSLECESCMAKMGVNYCCTGLHIIIDSTLQTVLLVPGLLVHGPRHGTAVSHISEGDDTYSHISSKAGSGQGSLFSSTTALLRMCT